MGIIAYFHRLTTLILTTLSDIVDATDSDDEDEGDTAPMLNVMGVSRSNSDLSEGPEVVVRGEEVERMGLDSWSARDRDFLTEVVGLYFGRKGMVEGRSVDVCGVRIC